jgi:hypothetical protein
MIIMKKTLANWEIAHIFNASDKNKMANWCFPWLEPHKNVIPKNS